jgi:hypothetical protein
VNKKDVRRYSNSDDSSQSQDERDLVKEDIRGSLDMKPHSVHSHKSIIRGSIKEESKLEMRDLRASGDDKVRSLPSKQKITGGIHNNQSHEEIKSAESFNRSDLIQDSPEMNKASGTSAMQRTTSYFGVPFGNGEETGRIAEGNPLIESRNFNLMNSNPNPGITSSLTRGNLANVLGAMGNKVHSSVDMSQHRGLGGFPPQ